MKTLDLETCECGNSFLPLAYSRFSCSMPYRQLTCVLCLAWLSSEYLSVDFGSLIEAGGWALFANGINGSVGKLDSRIPNTPEPKIRSCGCRLWNMQISAGKCIDEYTKFEFPYRFTVVLISSTRVSSVKLFREVWGLFKTKWTYGDTVSPRSRVNFHFWVKNINVGQGWRKTVDADVPRALLLSIAVSLPLEQ